MLFSPHENYVVECERDSRRPEKRLQPEQYTWWPYYMPARGGSAFGGKTFARKRNVGWRIDYHFVTQDLVAQVKDASIHMEVEGSDHCPIELELKL